MRKIPKTPAQGGGFILSAGSESAFLESVEDFAVLQQALQGLLAIVADLDRVALGFEIEAQAFGEVGFVFDDEDVAHAW